MRNFLARFMYGRYGVDRFSRFLTFTGAAILIISIFIPGIRIVYYIGLAMMIWSIFRSFSKNAYKRRAELNVYLSIAGKIKDKISIVFRKDFFTHRIIKCCTCGAKLRLPRRKGKIAVTCPKCRTESIVKT